MRLAGPDVNKLDAGELEASMHEIGFIEALDEAGVWVESTTAEWAEPLRGWTTCEIYGHDYSDYLRGVNMAQPACVRCGQIKSEDSE